jgi:hypothetical protein
LAKNLIAPKSKQKVLNFRKIHTPRFLGCYNDNNADDENESGEIIGKKKKANRGAPVRMV